MSKRPKIKSKVTPTPANPKEELNADLRLQQLESNSKTREVDNTMDIMSYYNNSTNMIVKADQQFVNNNLEIALLTYLKFLDLFRNKIHRHVDFKRVPLSARCSNQYYQLHAAKKVQELRTKLLQRYRDIATLHQNLQTSNTAGSRHQHSQKHLWYDRSRSISTIDPIDRAAFDVEGSKQLRTVVVPKQLPTVFQIVTQKIRSETFSAWGTLMGTLQNNEYVITHLVIPCQDEREQGKFVGTSSERYAQEHRLTILGWIHSHRPASCYMSSDDLHAHLKFQRVLPEAVAIVCAPRFTQVEYYVLLKFGMEFVGRCAKVGTHAHDADRPLYTIARHVKVVYDRRFEMVDLEAQEKGIVY